jgi:hypothetical protein
MSIPSFHPLSLQSIFRIKSFEFLGSFLTLVFNMKFNAFALFSVFVPAALAASALQTYIVVLQPGAVSTKIDAILKLVPGVAAPGAAQQWSANGFTGFTALLAPGQVKVLQASADVS